jgi:hypothetical protein
MVFSFLGNKESISGGREIFISGEIPLCQIVCPEND